MRCMSADGVGNMEYNHGIMNKTVYNKILKKNVKQSAEKLGMLPLFIFQEDNDSKHIAEISKLWIIWNVPHQL